MFHSHLFHGNIRVHMRGSLLLALDDQARGEMRHSDGRIGRVDCLSTGTRRLHVGEFEILRLEFDLRIGDGGRDDDHARGSVKLTTSFSRGGNSGEEEEK